jgi:hypothetical protein
MKVPVSLFRPKCKFGLFYSGTVKLRNCIIRKPPPLTVLKPTTGPSQMQQQKRPAVPTKPTPLVIPQTIKFSPAGPNGK